MSVKVDDLPPVAIPRTITKANRELLAQLGTPAFVRRTIYLVRPESDIVWIEAAGGDVAVRPGELVAYDPDTKRASRVTAEEAAAYELAPESETVPAAGMFESPRT
jgi:hypothetical protein